MTVGEDSYVTIEEANAYIVSYYRTNNKGRIRWEVLSEEDKGVLLINACSEIDRLPFHGHKVVSEQKLAFPRLPYQYSRTEKGAPESIKAAQIELALYLSDEEKQEELSKRKELQAQGVESFSVGDLSESYSNGSSEKPVPLLFPKSEALLRPYLSGGYSTC